jgi:aldehyde dehydrogenase (NAD+)
VSDVDEAVRLANGRGFGLGASVFSRHRGNVIAQRVHSGMVAINCALAFVGIPALPFGGVGQSGFGRTHGADGLREFSVPKSYARELFALPGMDTVTLRPKATTIRLIRLLMRLRHRK